MRILSVNRRPYLPQQLGAVEQTTFELVKHLTRGGHDAALMCGLNRGDAVWLRNRLIAKVSGREFPQERYPGFLDGVTLLANSRCTAGVISQCLGRDSTVLTPLIDREAYRTSGSRGYVTMVNPRRIKGGQTAFELAQTCPDIPFAFVEAWTEKEDFLTQLRKAARRLPNVKWRRPTLRMREVYGATRILLAPSELEESWGRVASAAQVAGIPVVASATGGLPEAVGPGGILIEPGAPLAHWIRALRSLWDDPTLYAQLSERARAHSERPESDPQRQVEVLVESLRGQRRTPAR